MTENAGTEPRVAAAEQTVREQADTPDATQVAEDPSGEAAALAGAPTDPVTEPDER